MNVFINKIFYFLSVVPEQKYWYEARGIYFMVLPGVSILPLAESNLLLQLLALLWGGTARPGDPARLLLTPAYLCVWYLVQGPFILRGHLPVSLNPRGLSPWGITALAAGAAGSTLGITQTGHIRCGSQPRNEVCVLSCLQILLSWQHLASCPPENEPWTEPFQIG